MVIAAGSTGSIPATRELLKVIAHLPNGAVVLPGLDRMLDDASWETLDPGHPQYGLKQLLDRIGATRDSVKDWDGGAARTRRNSAAWRARSIWRCAARGPIRGLIASRARSRTAR